MYIRFYLSHSELYLLRFVTGELNEYVMLLHKLCPSLPSPAISVNSAAAAAAAAAAASRRRHCTAPQISHGDNDRLPAGANCMDRREIHVTCHTYIHRLATVGRRLYQQQLRNDTADAQQPRATLLELIENFPIRTKCRFQ